MKNKGLLYAIVASLVLSSMLTACADTEGSDTTASNTQAIASQTTVETDKSTENATDAVTDTQATTAPEMDKMTDAPATNAPVEDTKAPETQVPETDPPATKAPETQAPADDKVYASKEDYPDGWGSTVITDDVIQKTSIITDGKILFWKNSRVMHTVPEGLPPVEDWGGIFLDEKNDQMFFFTGKMSDGTYTYYSMVNGEFYKLSEGKIVSRSRHSGAYQLLWIEDNGVAKSVNVRSKKWNEVYKEAEGVKKYNSKRPYTYIKFDDKVISPIAENILIEVTKIK